LICHRYQQNNSHQNKWQMNKNPMFKDIVCFWVTLDKQMKKTKVENLVYYAMIWQYNIFIKDFSFYDSFDIWRQTCHSYTTYFANTTEEQCMSVITVKRPCTLTTEIYRYCIWTGTKLWMGLTQPFTLYYESLIGK
jgi:hypothetical protein